MQDPALENLANIEKLMGKDYVANFIDEGLAEISRLVTCIQKDAGSRDADLLRNDAHQLKGISAMFGLGDVQTLAEGIEACCFEQRLEEALKLCTRLKESNEAALSAFRRMLPTTGWVH